MKLQKFSLGAMGTNCYFIIDEPTKLAAVTDPGDDAKTIFEKLNERGLKCQYILLTHGHYDHIMALNELRALTEAPVLMHADDANMLADPELSYMRRFGGLELTFNPPERTVSDGDIIKLGGTEIEVMHSPGHSPGSVCYLIRDKDKNYLISGDTLFAGDVGLYTLTGGSYSALVESLHRIAALDGEWLVYPGHGPSTRLSRERETNMYLN